MRYLTILLALLIMCLEASAPAQAGMLPGNHAMTVKAPKASVGILTLTIKHDSATSSVGATNANSPVTLHKAFASASGAAVNASSRSEVRPATIARYSGHGRDPGDGDDSDYQRSGGDDDEGLPKAART